MDILRIIANKLNWILADPEEAIWGSASSPESLSKQSSRSEFDAALNSNSNLSLSLLRLWQEKEEESQI